MMSGHERTFGDFPLTMCFEVEGMFTECFRVNATSEYHIFMAMDEPDSFRLTEIGIVDVASDDRTGNPYLDTARKQIQTRIFTKELTDSLAGRMAV